MSDADLPEIDKEEDSSLSSFLPNDRIEEIKAKREEDRKDADSAHARSRDTLVTISGMILVLVLIILYNCAIEKTLPDREFASLFLNLLDSVVMLIIGYIFGTKITRN
jgi:hypothetical protein